LGGVVIQQYQNNPGNILIQGLELQAEADVARTLGIPIAEGSRWGVWGNGYYNFTMTDYGAVPAAGSTQATRVNQYQLSIGTRYSRLDAEMPWSIQLTGVLNGPMWYNTEEALSPIYFPVQARNVTVYEKGAYWVWNTRYDIEFKKGVNFFLAVNNILDVNQDPVFIVLDQSPCRANFAAQNGSCGNSMMGREVVVGAKVQF
jgi:vitamin B12 transporter